MIKKPIIIAILNPKGGCGKTTIAINLAHAFKNIGYKTLLVDTDVQGSARDWNEKNEGSVLPVIGLDRMSLAADIEAVKNEYNIIIIDGASQISNLTSIVIKIADIVIIPVHPSPFDIWAVDDLIELIKSGQKIADDKPLSYFVISAAIKNTNLSREVVEALKPYKIAVLNSYTTKRVIYQTSASKGHTIYTSIFNDATLEINGIRDEIIEVINDFDTKK